MKADGSNEHLITHSAGGVCDGAPAWSPDGRWIVYERDNGNTDGGALNCHPSGRQGSTSGHAERRLADLAAPLTSPYTRSITAAMAWPKPMHIVARPYRASRRSSSETSVAVIRAPVAPSGWPSEMPPPFGFTSPAS
jgi:hypothetical protein